MLQLQADQAGVTQAATLLQAGRLVSFPTETVYGLGADARNSDAVSGVFAAKDRPDFNPLIVHLADAEAVARHVTMTPAARALAQAFWPGALTLVLPVRADAGISSLVTAGLKTLAVRVPDHPVAQALLRAFDGPIAAPSANPSGRISPTTAAHVMTGLGDRIDAVIDGGGCGVGLESTIVSCAGPPTLLRAGGVPQEAIEACLGHPIASQSHASTLVSPGQMISHYAPHGTVRLNAQTPEKGELFLGFGPGSCDINLSETADLRQAAARLFDCLHQLDAMGAARIAVAPIPMTGLGVAINDRLARAAAPRDGD